MMVMNHTQDLDRIYLSKKKRLSGGEWREHDGEGIRFHSFW